MKVEDKPKFLKESRELLSSINFDGLIQDPNNFPEIKKINRLIAIFTNFSYNDGQELRRLFFEFLKWVRRSSSIGTIKNRVTDILQFVDQKIQEMDIYQIEEPVSEKQDKIVKSLKDQKLWARSSLEGKDLHILIGERGSKAGEHVHLISDSETGELRVDPDDKTPKELVERVVSITTKYGQTVGISQYGVKTTMEFINKETINDKEVPILYAIGAGRSGGSKGHFENFEIKNIGKNIALDIHWGIRGFAYEWRPDEKPFELDPGQKKGVIFPISEEKIFNETVPELNVIMEYKDVDNTPYFSRRELKQIKVPSGAFFVLETDVFHPPTILVDDGLELIFDPIVKGDGVEAEFKVNTKDGIKRVKIGIAGSLIGVFGFNSDDLIKQAMLELSHRLIRKMVKSNNLANYCFTTSDLPENNPGGFEAYLLLRNKVSQ